MAKYRIRYLFINIANKFKGHIGVQINTYNGAGEFIYYTPLQAHLCYHHSYSISLKYRSIEYKTLREEDRRKDPPELIERFKAHVRD